MLELQQFIVNIRMPKGYYLITCNSGSLLFTKRLYSKSLFSLLSLAG